MTSLKLLFTLTFAVICYCLWASLQDYGTGHILTETLGHFLLWLCAGYNGFVLVQIIMLMQKHNGQ